MGRSLLFGPTRRSTPPASGTRPVPPTTSPAGGLAHAEADDEQARAQLGTIGVAVHRFADGHNNKLPNNIYSAKGEALLSWRVTLLPELGEDQKRLFQQFRLGERWDSEHNKALLVRMPSVYALPGLPGREPGDTFVQGMVGGPGIKPRAVFMQGDTAGVGLSIPDGRSNTLFAHAALAAVEWTKPEDVAFAPDAPPVLAGHYGGRALILLLDGSTRLAPLARFTPDVVRGLATIDTNASGVERFELPLTVFCVLCRQRDHFTTPRA